MKLKLLLLLLLCSCVAHKATEQQSEGSSAPTSETITPPIEADTLSQDSPLDTIQQKPTVQDQTELTLPPDTAVVDSAVSEDYLKTLSPQKQKAKSVKQTYCPPCPPPVAQKPRIIYRQNEKLTDSLRRELNTEKLANAGFREKLKNTEAQRDYWREKNRQKFWTLIVMAIFAALYILFKVLAARVRNAEE